MHLHPWYTGSPLICGRSGRKNGHNTKTGTKKAGKVRTGTEYMSGSMNDKNGKKNKTAIALEYDPQDAAPKIVATGKGIIAEKILEKAKEAAVPIHEDSKLADTLSKLEIGEMIPPELYSVVAEILVFVDAMDKIKAKMEKSGRK